MGEVWKPVVSYEGWYEVSDQGRVRNVKDRYCGRPGRLSSPAGHIMTGCPSKKGYLKMCLTANRKQKVRHVHRLVGEAFLGPLPAGLQTDHINGDQADNRLANLRYVTGLENMRKSYEPRFHRHVPRGDEHSRSKLTEAQVREIKRLLQAGVIHRKLAQQFHITRAAISAISAGYNWAWVT